MLETSLWFTLCAVHQVVCAHMVESLVPRESHPLVLFKLETMHMLPHHWSSPTEICSLLPHPLLLKRVRVLPGPTRRLASFLLFKLLQATSPDCEAWGRDCNVALHFLPQDLLLSPHTPLLSYYTDLAASGQAPSTAHLTPLPPVVTDLTAFEQALSVMLEHTAGTTPSSTALVGAGLGMLLAFSACAGLQDGGGLPSLCLPSRWPFPSRWPLTFSHVFACSNVYFHR